MAGTPFALPADSDFVGPNGDNTGAILTGCGLSVVGGGATINLRAGSETGVIVLPVQLADGQSTSETDMDVWCQGGVYCELTVEEGAELTGSIWIA